MYTLYAVDEPTGSTSSNGEYTYQYTGGLVPSESAQSVMGTFQDTTYSTEINCQALIFLEQIFVLNKLYLVAGRSTEIN